ncbi:hypothetical protein M8C21_030037, partial [Ambrosia artemisiifolia]
MKQRCCLFNRLPNNNINLIITTTNNNLRHCNGVSWWLWKASQDLTRWCVSATLVVVLRLVVMDK